MLKQRLAQKLQQKLSPQQIQLMKLLQVPTANLEMRIKEELEANPALEIGTDQTTDELEEGLDKSKEEREDDTQAEVGEEDFELEDYMADDEIADYKLRDNNYPDPDEDRTIPIKVNKTFHEFLLDQLGLENLDDRRHQIAEQIIGSIGDDGYLTKGFGSHR